MTEGPRKKGRTQHATRGGEIETNQKIIFWSLVRRVAVKEEMEVTEMEE
jgi:hypothetical protein